MNVIDVAQKGRFEKTSPKKRTTILLLTSSTVDTISLKKSPLKMDSKTMVLVGLLFTGTVAAAYFYTKAFPKKEGLGGRGGGGHSGGRISGKGFRGSMGGRRGGYGHQWRGRWKGGWRGRSYGDYPGSWPWWWSWWYDPFYYVDDPRVQSMKDDPCDCFGKYKAAVDAGVTKDDAKKILTSCVDKTIGGIC